MSSFSDYARARLTIDTENTKDNIEGMCGPLNLKDREIYYEVSDEEYYPQILFSYGDETLKLKRDNLIYELTIRNQAELEAILPDGKVTWFKGTEAPYQGCGELTAGGHYTGKYNKCEDLIVNVYDNKTNKVIKYKLVKESEKDMSEWEKSFFSKNTEDESKEEISKETKATDVVIDDSLPF